MEVRTVSDGSKEAEKEGYLGEDEIDTVCEFAITKIKAITDNFGNSR